MEELADEEDFTRQGDGAREFFQVSCGPDGRPVVRIDTSASGKNRVGVQSCWTSLDFEEIPKIVMALYHIHSAHERLESKKEREGVAK